METARKRCRREDIRGPQIPLDDLALVESFQDEQLLQLDLALEKLATINADAAAIVKLRFFAGLTVKQAAEILGFSLRTANRNWTYARSWIHRELENCKSAGTPA